MPAYRARRAVRTGCITGQHRYSRYAARLAITPLSACIAASVSSTTPLSLLDKGATRIAILDVDFHHGNGTQDIV